MPLKTQIDNRHGLHQWNGSTGWADEPTSGAPRSPTVGDGSHYYNARRDVILARSDWLVKNNANLLFKVKASSTVSLQFGVQDDFTLVPGSGYVANIIGAFFSVPIRRAGTLRDIEPFIRLGAHTHHAYRSGFQLFAGVSIAWGVPVGSKRAL